MNIEIDKNSGYCFGVEFAISMAEDEMKNSGSLYCLGDIVHNGMEVKRLAAQGLKIIDRAEMENIHDAKVLIRAHGEPADTYKLALKNNIELIDASCPVVLKLQNRIKNSFDKMEDADGQIVIYGKPGHAEVIGLTAQTRDKAIIVMNDEDLDLIDYSRPVTLYSQTTKSTKGFYRIKSMIEERILAEKEKIEVEDFKANDSICRQVSNREPSMEKFSQIHDVILFVSGKKSSNGKALYSVCKRFNNKSYFIENEEEIDLSWINTDDSVGICGATSTPMWLMERVQKYVKGKLELKPKLSNS